MDIDREREIFIKISGTSNMKLLFVNSLIWRGRKVAAEYFLHDLLCSLKLLYNKNHYDVFYYSLVKLRPLIDLRPLKVGSFIYKVPAYVKDRRKRFLAIKFLTASSKNRKGVLSNKRLSENFMLVFNSIKNPAMDKKLALYNEASRNRPYLKNR